MRRERGEQKNGVNTIVQYPFMVALHDAASKNPDETWAACQPEFVFNDGSGTMRGLPLYFYQIERVQIFGNSLNSIPKYPYRLLVYPVGRN